MGQKFYQKASVQVAMVPGVVALIIAAGHIWLTHSGVKKENIKLSQANQGLRDDLVTAKSEVQRLETLLTPFRTIALARYTGSEGEALRQLADQIGILQDADKQKSEKITQLEAELGKTQSLAEPCKLALHSKAIKKEENGYRVTLIFKPTKNERLGLLAFVAVLPVNSSERILDFWPTAKGPSFESGKDSKKIGDDGKSARLMYSLVGFAFPSVDLVVSGPTTVQVQGNNGLETFKVDIK